MVYQWDPDHDPSGRRIERRAIQLGLRGTALQRDAREWVLDIEDISPFVAAQREHAQPSDLGNLLTPREDVYPVTDPDTAARLGLD